MKAVELDSGPAVSVPLAVATWALFVGLALMLAGAGLFATLVGVRADAEGFPTTVLGVISAAYYTGFLVGSRVALHTLGTVGHIRVYAALASVLAATIVVVGMVPHPALWVLLRFVTGLCIAGQYVVAESWLNGLASNTNRGRLLAVYGLVTGASFGLGQAGVAPLDPTELTGFALAAVAISMAIAPVALSEDAHAPTSGVPERLPLSELWDLVPTGVITSLLVGLAHGAFFGLGAFYAARSGLDVVDIGLFVAAPTVGALVLQIPIGMASDEVDRRVVGAAAAFVATGAAIALLVTDPTGWSGRLCMLVLGGTTFPLYSIAGAYTTDWVPPPKLTAAASQLVMLFGAGALAGPVVGALAMERLGPDGFVWTAIVVHLAIMTFLLVRIVVVRAPLIAKPWNEVSLPARVFQVPATVLSMGRRIRPRRTVRPGDADHHPGPGDMAAS